LDEVATSAERGRRAARAIVLAAVTIVSLAAAEVAARVIDGYAVMSLRLRPAAPSSAVRSGGGKFDDPGDAAVYVDRLPVAAGVSRQWYRDPLPVRPRLPPDSELERRALPYTGDAALHVNYEWNEAYVRRVLCGGRDDERSAFAPLDDAFAFAAGGSTEWPTYRYLRSARYPDGLRTNAFGWRSQEITVRKPPRTIRLAFVGASTTVGAHALTYSYPELIGIWLNRWAAARHPGVVFETINGGREGINSRSIQAVVTQELVPVAPDLIVYYEGANQFWPADYVGAVTFPPRPGVSGPRPAKLSAYSDLAGRVDSMIRRAVQPGAEPPKTVFPINWPKNLDERDPDLTVPNLPINLPQVLADLETMRRAAEAGGARLVTTSFMWLVYPGMVLDSGRDKMLFDYLNVGYWPFSYAHLRRYLDFQNRVFQKYAGMHHLDFIDFAAQYPRDPRLFSDAIHMTVGGIHLQAWIMFNGLVPILERAIEAKSLPRADVRSIEAHPAFGPRRLLDVRAARSACGSSLTE
jgi:hypothetical protein